MTSTGIAPITCTILCEWKHVNLFFHISIVVLSIDRFLHINPYFYIELYYNVINRVISYWPCYLTNDCRIGPSPQGQITGPI